MYIVPNFSLKGEHVHGTNEDNHEDGLLLAARFELAGSTACFKFKPVAPNTTGYAARERHISGIVQYSSGRHLRVSTALASLSCHLSLFMLETGPVLVYH